MARYSGVREFADEIGLRLQRLGLPRTGARMLGVLLVSNPPAQSLTDLCEVLDVSKSAASAAARRLLAMDMVEQVPSPEPPQAYYRFRPGGWTVLVRERYAQWVALHEVAESGLALLEGQDSALGERLQEAHDLFSLIEEQLPPLLERVEARHRRQG